MSSTVTTPSRHARGMPLPDIDTRTLYMKPATALTFGGWLTPPQSAHESRRDSLAQSFQSDAPFSNASSIGAVSTPATPMHFSGHGGDPFSQPWPQHTANQMVSHLPAPLGSDHFQSDGLYTPTQPANGALATIGTVGTYPHSGHTDAAESLEMPLRMASEQGFWAPHSYAVLQPGMHDIELRPTLFHSNQDLEDASMAPEYDSHDGSMNSLTLDTAAAAQHQGYDPVSASFYQHPQVIVPSQLSPADDWTMVPYPTYASPDKEMLPPGLSSVNSSFSSFDCFTPTTPDDEYFLPSEDEGYANVKREPFASPSPGMMQLGNRLTGVSKSRSYRSRGKGSKRGKTNVPRALFHNAGASCEVLVEGKWHFDNEGKAFLERSAPPSKPHGCDECGMRFERSEHLKRHQKSHADSRDYPCPLPGCTRKDGISRSDNATDHFKTHLKGPRKGQRNKHFEWPTLKRLLLDVYSEKEAQKLILKLERAVWKENELKEQRCHFL